MQAKTELLGEQDGAHVRLAAPPAGQAPTDRTHADIQKTTPSDFFIAPRQFPAYSEVSGAGITFGPGMPR